MNRGGDSRHWIVREFGLLYARLGARGYRDIDAIDRMELWLVGSLLGLAEPPDPNAMPRVSREEWPELPDDYEQLDRVAQRSLYYLGKGPRPETEVQDPAMLAALGIDPTALLALEDAAGVAPDGAPLDPAGLAGFIG